MLPDLASKDTNYPSWSNYSHTPTLFPATINTKPTSDEYLMPVIPQAMATIRIAITYMFRELVCVH
jgi:hypothetical protein